MTFKVMHMIQIYIGVICKFNGLLLLQMYQITFAALLVSDFMKIDGWNIEIENTHIQFTDTQSPL